MTSQTDSLTLVGVVIGLIALAFYLMDRAGKAGDKNVPTTAGTAPIFWWQTGTIPATATKPAVTVAYDPFLTSPARSEFLPGMLGDLQMFITTITTDTGLRW